MKTQKLIGWISLIIISVSFGCLGGFAVEKLITIVQAQDDTKTVALAFAINPQFKFTDIKVGDQPISLIETTHPKHKWLKIPKGEVFNAQSDWIKNLSFKIESISKKPITFVQVNVDFPETRATGSLMSYAFSFGKHPGRKMTGSKPILIMPGESFEISLNKEMEKIKKFMSGRESVESIQKVELEIRRIGFEDNTEWNLGEFFQRDPNTPGKLERIDNLLPK